jgi:hypothetical protein
MQISIGRSSGPATDDVITTEVTPEELEAFKDCLAMVNAVTRDKERWFIALEDGTSVVPTINVGR